MFSKRVQIFIFIVSNSEAWPRGDEVGMEKWNKVKWPQILFLLHCTLKLKSSIGVKEKQSKTKYTEIICRRDDKIKNSELWDWVGTHRQKERTFHFSLRTHKTRLLAHSQQPRGRESFLVMTVNSLILLQNYPSVSEHHAHDIYVSQAWKKKLSIA